MPSVSANDKEIGITILDASNFQLFLDFYLASRPLWKKSDTELIPKNDRASVYHDWLERCLGSGDRERIYALMIDGKISYTLAIHRWMSLPYYTTYSFTGLATPSPKLGVIPATRRLFDRVLLDMESEGRFTFYFVTLLSYLQDRDSDEAGTHSFFQRCVPSLQRYSFSIEDIVRAGTKSNWPTFWNMMFESPHGQDLIIRSAKLKPKYLLKKINEGL